MKTIASISAVVVETLVLWRHSDHQRSSCGRVRWGIRAGAAGATLHMQQDVLAPCRAGPAFGDLLARPFGCQGPRLDPTRGSRRRRRAGLARRALQGACRQRQRARRRGKQTAATSAIERRLGPACCRFTPHGVTAAWWPPWCKLGSAGAGAESSLNRLQRARSRLAPVPRAGSIRRSTRTRA